MITSVGNSTGPASPASPLLSTGASERSPSGGEPVTAPSIAAPDTAQISGRGQLLSQLHQLQATNPTQFRRVAADLAAQMQSSAQDQGSSPQADSLQRLATELRTAAGSGKMPALKPEAPTSYGQLRAVAQLIGALTPQELQVLISKAP